jgi:hypothetical protein
LGESQSFAALPSSAHGKETQWCAMGLQDAFQERFSGFEVSEVNQLVNATHFTVVHLIQYEKNVSKVSLIIDQ